MKLNNLMNSIRIISDIHGKVDEYINLTKQCDYSIQLGDMGNYSFLDKIDPNKHKFFSGNHEQYDFLLAAGTNFLHNMGDFGEFELNGIKGFFIRGAFSIDWKRRQDYYLQTGIKVLFEQEQLTDDQLYTACKLYAKHKPDLMLTHDCPISVSRKMGSKKVLQAYSYDPLTFTSRTQEALQYCLELHKPKLWHFSHFHFNKNEVWKSVRWVCRRELGWTDINQNLEIIGSSNEH